MEVYGRPLALAVSGAAEARASMIIVQHALDIKAITL